MYVLKLYVTARAPNAVRALGNIRRICQENLGQDYRLEVIDVVQHPELAEADRIIATPTLVKQSPLPTRKLLGDLSDHQKVLLELDLPSRGDSGDPLLEAAGFCDPEGGEGVC